MREQTTESSRAPYYHCKLPDGRWLIPRDPIENVKWRIRCRERALEDKRFRDALWQACMDDLLFFMAAVCWGYDPRARIKVVPFIPHPHQEKVFLAMDEAIDRAGQEERSIDVILDKARAQGGTFGYLWIDLRRWLRDRMFSAGYVTRNEDLVDSKTDSNTVLWKIAWAIQMLPVWMQPDYERHLGQHTFVNNENMALLRGYAAGQDVGAGGRATVFTVDEAGARDFVAGGKDEAVQESIQDVSNCIRLVSARYVDQGVFHEACENPDTAKNGIYLVLDWKDHPDHGKNSYVVVDGKPVARKPEEQEAVDEYHRDNPDLRARLERKGFKFDGVVRSPWYDMRCVGWGTWVVTERGPVQIQDVGLTDRVWDGTDWVSQDGCVFQGWKETIRSYRVNLTQDHPVLTTKGWKHASEGFDREEVRLPDGYREKWLESVEAGNVDVSVCVRGDSGNSRCISNERWSEELRVQATQPTLQNTCVQLVGRDDSALLEPESSEVPSVRRSWDSGVREVDGVRELSGGHGAATAWAHDRQDRQRRELRAEQLPLGDSQAAAEQPSKHHICRDSHGIDDGTGSCDGVGNDHRWDTEPHQERLDGGRSFASTQNPMPVYDLLNCGPRRAFTVLDDDGRPLLVHNCLRPTATPRLIASQLDRNPRGAVGKVFPSDLLDRMKREHCKPPVWVGQPVFDAETLKLTGLIPRDDGPLKLWFKPGIDNMPPLGPFTAGCDIASGGVSQYATNSTMAALDDRTGEQVLEYAIKGLEPRPFARRVVGLCMWLRGALLGWEDSGVSGGFAKEVMEVIYYGNVFFRDVTQLGSQKKSRKPGWPCRDADKADMFEQMALAMETGQFIPRSEEMLTECGEYEWDGDKIIHAPTKNKGAAEKNHADRAVASGGCWLVYSTDSAGDRTDTGEEDGTIPEVGSFLWREQQERKQAGVGSPRFGIRDVVGW